MANGAISGPPAVDFYSMLSGLGDTLQNNAKIRAKQTLDANRAGAFRDFTALDPRSPEFGQQALSIAHKLGSSGDTEGAFKFLGLATDTADKTRAQSNADRSFKLQEDNARRTQSNADREWNYDPTEERTEQARARGLDPNSPTGQKFILTGTLPDNFAGGGAKYGVNPVYGTTKGPDGVETPSMVQLSSDGTVVQPRLPEGFKIARDPIKIDNGTHWTLLDPQTRQIIGTQPKNVAETESQKVVGDAAGNAKVNLPLVKDTSAQILKTINDIETHKGLASSVGAWSVLPVIPGTERANFRSAAAQLKGQTFLQAYQSLKGSGAITDIEGKKGEDAIARLDTAQTEQAYRQALADFKSVVNTGLLRAQGRARMADADGPAPTGPRWASDQDGTIVHQDGAGNKIAYDLNRKMWVPYRE